MLVIAGCQSEKSPVEIDKGVDMCESCRMTISDFHSAAEIIESSKVHKFDDIGCMLAYAQTSNLNFGNANFWVMDYDSLSWVNADVAYYVLSPSIRTPMGYGIIAFKDSIKANEFADKIGGKIERLESLFKTDWRTRHTH
ncbi:MAG: nitrous oxide reductase accessory protein NosL [Deltaproteobacteria bacterium]|nr:nitrous oxide reductase accessory protein NosL [Deltaproteobacteria bacterium]